MMSDPAASENAALRWHLQEDARVIDGLRAEVARLRQQQQRDELPPESHVAGRLSGSYG